MPELTKEKMLELLGGLDSLLKKHEESLEPQQKRELYQGASTCTKTKAFNDIFNDLERRVMVDIAKDTKTDEVPFYRLTLNVIELIRDEFKSLAGKFENLNKPEDKFNKHEII